MPFIEELLTIVIYGVIILSTWGLVFWAKRAEIDRSAIVGLYIVLGAPAVLLFVLGVAFTINGRADGPTFMTFAATLGLPLTPNVREFLARFTPLNPRSPTDMVGLAVLLTVIAFFAVSLANQTAPLAGDDVTPVGYFDLIAQGLLFVGLAYACVGVRISRNWREATERLGIRMPTAQGFSIAVALVVVGFMISVAAGVLTEALQPDYAEQVSEFTGQLTTEINNPLGAVVLGASAGIGEEALFRGAVQPRFGIGLTALLFALVHVQYGFSYVILGLFGIGVMLGFIRQRYGTVAAMITHALYNTVAVLLSIYV